MIVPLQDMGDIGMPNRTPQTYLTPESGRPTHASLSKALELEVPHRFARFVSDLYDYGNGDPRRSLDAFDPSLGLYPNGPSARYDGTPPELFPIGSTGCDGDHYGFLLRAPELRLPDLPICHYCPMDSDGVIVVGSNTEQGISATMARLLSYDFVKPDRKRLIESTAKACGIQPSMSPVIDVIVPDGWQFVPSSDGVGTLAPSQLFDSQVTHTVLNKTQPEAILTTAESAIHSGYFATALHFLREGLWCNWFHKPVLLASKMALVYQAMNRNELAGQMLKSISRWQQPALN